MVKLDDIDWAIVRALFRWDQQRPGGDWRVPVRELARRSGVPVTTATRRLAGLRRAGVLEGTFFEPAAQPLGLERGGFVFQDIQKRGVDDITRVLAGFPSLSVAIIGHGVFLSHIWAETGQLEGIAKRLSSALGAKATIMTYHTGRMPHPPTMPPAPAADAQLSLLDRRLIVELRAGQDRTIDQVARRMGVTRRTVERRGARLVAAGLGAMRPRFRVSKAEGRILVDYFVIQGDDRARSSLAKVFPDALLAGGPHVFIDVANLAEAERRRAQAMGLPGIDRIEAYLIEDILFPEAFEAWLAGHVADPPSIGASKHSQRAR